MSAEFLTISKGKDLPVVKDYAKLRALGIKYIEQLGSDLWTDYNTHDPGITILEMLCYAITDLGFRTNFDIKDILALEPGLKYFHTASEILTMNPVTVNDYRKLVIDVEGVRNAWLIPTERGGFYLNEKDEILTWTKEADFPEIFVKGLYEILIEFEENDEFGDLNENNFDSAMDLDEGEEELEFIFPKWMELAELGEVGRKLRQWAEIGTTTEIEMSPVITVDDELNAYEVTATIHYTYPTPVPDIVHPFGCYTDNLDDAEAPEQTPYVPGTEGPETVELTFHIRFDGDYDVVTDQVFPQLQKVIPENPIIFYQGRLNLTFEIVENVRCTLMDHRNLCEDFLEINSLKTEEIALCVDIEIDRMADVNFIQAKIFEIVGEFISPTVHFYTLAEMFKKTQANGQKYTSDKIFNGPRLKHGFILDSELNAAILRTEIHTSDLYNLIMDIPGVLAVKELQVANFIDGLPLTKGEEWLLPLKGDGLHVPKLSQDRSKITFYKDVIPYKANPNKVAEYLAEQKAKNLRLRLEDIDLDIEVPEADSPGIGEYTTIMNGFPLTYGVGLDGIPGGADDLRKSQARQMKGYLLQMDQLLANFMAQLSHVRDLLSMDPNGDTRTYFTQVIKDVKEVEDLYGEYDGGLTDPFAEVQNALDDIAESDEVRYERKNRFLDHLMARFAESFSEYSLVMFALDRENAAELLVEDKLQFLNDYPEISGNRFRAYNYRPKLDCDQCDPMQLWETEDNVSGYKKRVSRLLGIESYERGNLTCHCFSYAEIDHNGFRPNTWVFYLKDCNDPNAGPNDYLLRSVEFESEETAKFMITYALAMVEKGNLKEKPEEAAIGCKCCDVVEVDNLNDYDPDAPHGPRFVLLNRCGDVIACSMEWADDEERKEKFDYTQNYILSYCTVEGFHLIEHILLRPQLPDDDTGDDFLPICLCPADELVTPSTDDGTTPYADLYVEFMERGVKQGEKLNVLNDGQLLQIWNVQLDEFTNQMVVDFGGVKDSKTPGFFLQELAPIDENLLESSSKFVSETFSTEKTTEETTTGERNTRSKVPSFFNEPETNLAPKQNSRTFNRLNAKQVSQLRNVFDRVFSRTKTRLNPDTLFSKVLKREELKWNETLVRETSLLNPPVTLWGFRVRSNTGKVVLTSVNFNSPDAATEGAKKLLSARQYLQNYRLYQPIRGKEWAFEVYNNTTRKELAPVVVAENVKTMRGNLQSLRKAVGQLDPGLSEMRSDLLNAIRLLEDQSRKMQAADWDNSKFDDRGMSQAKAALQKIQDERDSVSKELKSKYRLAKKGYSDFLAPFERAFPWTPTSLSYEIYEEKDDDGVSELRFRIRDSRTGKIVLSSSTKYESAEAAEAEMRLALDMIGGKGALVDETAKNKDFYFNVVDENRQIVARKIAMFKSSMDRASAKAGLEAIVRASMMNGKVVLKPYDPDELPPASYLDHLEDWRKMLDSGLATPLDIEMMISGKVPLGRVNRVQMTLALPKGKSNLLASGTAGLDENFSQYQTMYRNTYSYNFRTLMRYEDTMDKAEAELQDYLAISQVNDAVVAAVEEMQGWLGGGTETEEVTGIADLTANSGKVIYSNLLATGNIFDSALNRNVEVNRLVGILPEISLPIGEGTVDDGRVKRPSKYCGEEADPYSFRISIILPAWAGRFKDIHFRQLVEKTLRMEAPAHVALKICWIDRYQMADFECKYLDWILEKGSCKSTLETISPKLNALIEEMNSLQNVYPVATLHDCDDSPEDVAAVILNQTSLGTL